MEKSGLLWKTYQSNGRKGRPLGIYHATGNLSDFVLQHHRRSSLMLDFPVLSAMCRFNSRGVCDLTGLGPERCKLEVCPVLKTPMF